MKLTCFIISVLSLMLALQPNAPKGRYAIFKFSGDVAVRKDGAGGWSVAAKRMSVDLKDLCRISKGGSVSILDKETNRVFSVDEEGILEVKALIEKAEAASRRVTARLNDALASDLAMERRAVPTYSILGATTHAGGDDTSSGEEIPTLTDTVCCALRQYVDSLFAGLAIHSSDRMTVGKERVDEGEFCFVISNRTNSLYYFNILRLNHKTKNVSFCITPLEASAEIFIPDSMYLKLPQYPFAEDSENEYSYLFFATDEHVDFSALSEMMKEKKPAKIMPQCQKVLEVVSIL